MKTKKSQKKTKIKINLWPFKAACKSVCFFAAAVLLCLRVSAAVYTSADDSGDAQTVYVAGNPDCFPLEYYRREEKTFRGAIPDMLEDAVKFVRKNSRIKTIIDDNGRRADKPEYPVKAVREAILNALVHRDYSIHTENVPVRIEMYRDRMEIINSGGLYGKISIDALGKVRPETRNAALANMLELLNITENRYSGIPTMRNEFAKAGLPAPIFSAVHGEFKVIMKNGLYSDEEPADESVVEFCSTPRTRAEIVDFIGKSKNYVMSKIVNPLVKGGKLRMTIPDKPKSPNQRFVKA